MANGTFTITPSKAGFTFTPVTQTVVVTNGASVSGVNFTATAAPTGITIDATKTAGRSARGPNIASGAFSTTAGNELWLAFVEASNNETAATTVDHHAVRLRDRRQGTTRSGHGGVWARRASGPMRGPQLVAVGGWRTVMTQGRDTNRREGRARSAEWSRPVLRTSASLVTTEKSWSSAPQEGTGWPRGTLAGTDTGSATFLGPTADTWGRGTTTGGGRRNEVTINDTARRTIVKR